MPHTASTTLVLHAVLPALWFGLLASGSPLPLPTPLPTLLPRQIVGGVPILESVTSTSSGSPVTDTAAAVASTSTRGSGSYNGWAGGPWSGGQAQSPLLTAITIALICVVVVILLVARFFYVLRSYPPSVRAFFVPPGGIHWWKLHIKSAVPRPPTGPPPSYPRALGRSRNQRRGATAQGATIGEGGVREGTRDQDDAFDDDGEAGDKDVLPVYHVDIDLPGYDYRREAAEFLRANGGTEEAVLPTAAEYEAASRAARGAPVRTASSATTTTAPVVEMEMQERNTRQQQEEREVDGVSTASSAATMVDEEEAKVAKAKEELEQLKRTSGEGSRGDLGEERIEEETADSASTSRRGGA